MPQVQLNLHPPIGALANYRLYKNEFAVDFDQASTQQKQIGQITQAPVMLYREIVWAAKSGC